MKRSIVLLTLPLIMMAKTVGFNEALVLTESNNLELKAKANDIELARLTINEPDAYKKGALKFVENIARTNNAGQVFGMKLASREAKFADFGFDQFLGWQFAGMPGGQNYILNLEPKKLNYPDARNNFETKVVYEMPLFTGYKLENAKTMAKLQLKAKEAKLNFDKKQLGLEVLKAYNGAVTAKKFSAMLNNAAKIARRFQAIAQDMYDSGLTRYIDIEQAQMAAYSISTKAKEAATKYQLALAYLRFLTDDKSIKGIKSMKTFKFHTLRLARLQAKAIVNRDDLKWMKKNAQTMKTKIAYDSSDELPMVGVHAEYGTNDDTLSLSAKRASYLVAVGLKYNLFDGELTSLKKQKAKIEFQKTKEYQNLMTEGIKLQVEKSLKEYLMQTKTLKEKRKTAKMAENILKEMEDIYKNNLKFRTNMTYLLFSFGNMVQAQADVIQAEYDKNLVAGELQLAIGNSLGE